jgi:signal transduction histidine kinase
MQRNANVGSKLLALIAVPAVVLVAVASLGASQRLDDADRAQQTADGARLAAASTDVVHELQMERLLSMRLAQGDDEVADQLAEQRQTTDTAIGAFAAPRAAVGEVNVARRLDAAGGQMETVAAMRSSIDDGSAAPEVVLDAYTTAIDSLLELEAALVSRSGLPELSSTLTDSLTLSKAKEARALRSAEIASIATVGRFRSGEYQSLAELEAEEELQFARLKESQDGSMTTGVRNAMADESVREADALMAQVMDEGVIGGSGDPGVAPDDWQAAAAGWLTTVRAAERSTLEATIVTADAAAFEASKSARLYLIGTAAAVILSILLASLLARRINRRLQRLTVAANQLATVELPRLVEDLRSPGEQGAKPEPLVPLEVDSSDEIGQLAEAFNVIQQVTTEVAEEQAALLRRGIADIFVNLARRNQSLLDRQIEFIDGLEAQEQDPDQLENLFKLDHLATRMRRNAESLLVLAGAEPPRRRARPVELADVVRVAIGEVEDFTRIHLRSLDETTVGGNAAVDLAHLLSELMENATQFSPPDSTVEVVGARTPDGGYALTVADRGIGMSDDQLAEANALLESPPPVGLALSRSLGFIVVGRLARRLQIGVRLAASPAGGITALLQLPASVLAGQAEIDGRMPPATPPAFNGPTGLPPAPADEPRPLLEGTPFALAAPTGAVPDAPASLSDALPAGEDFERGLASLVDPTPAAPATDSELHEAFWGQQADAPVDDTFADLAGSADTAEGFPPPPPAPDGPVAAPTAESTFGAPATEPTFAHPAAPDWEPAPDWLDGELSSMDASAAASAAPMSTPAPPTAPTESVPLARRQPRATLTGDAAPPTASAANGVRTASTRRSPEEVRAMLSRYRRGIQDGRQAPGTED